MTTLQDWDNPIYDLDAYKFDHRRQYPKGTTRVLSNWTPRGSRIPGVDHVVFFGLQAFLQEWAMDKFQNFFDASENEVALSYENMVNYVLGPNSVGADHIRALHRLGYLPLEFKALPEGTRVPLRVPMFTIENTHDDFFWLVNYIETILSASIWLPCTSATQSLHLREMGNEWAENTGQAVEDMNFTFHDFSMRGMSNGSAAAASGAGHLLSSNGTDTIPALNWIERFYPTENWIGGSVAATEHSVMCAGGKEDETQTFERLLDLYPSGIVSVVSDTWDLWNVLTNILPSIKGQIMARNGKVVIRPDSGDPVDILCGTQVEEWADGHSYNKVKVDRWFGQGNTPEEKGVIELLWDTFGGTVNEAGFKVLDPHIGAIYGDAITYDRADEIFRRLSAKGFAATNVVLGVGSYTFQMVTRDTFGQALKATWAMVDGEGRDLFKDPVTDDGLKKSATGRLAVLEEAGKLVVVSKATQRQEDMSRLQTVWKDGQFVGNKLSFDDVKANMAKMEKKGVVK